MRSTTTGNPTVRRCTESLGNIVRCVEDLRWTAQIFRELEVEVVVLLLVACTLKVDHTYLYYQCSELGESVQGRPSRYAGLK